MPRAPDPDPRPLRWRTVAEGEGWEVQAAERAGKFLLVVNDGTAGMMGELDATEPRKRSVPRSFDTAEERLRFVERNVPPSRIDRHLLRSYAPVSPTINLLWNWATDVRKLALWTLRASSDPPPMAFLARIIRREPRELDISTFETPRGWLPDDLALVRQHAAEQKADAVCFAYLASTPHRRGKETRLLVLVDLPDAEWEWSWHIERDGNCWRRPDRTRRRRWGVTAGPLIDRPGYTPSSSCDLDRLRVFLEARRSTAYTAFSPEDWRDLVAHVNHAAHHLQTAGPIRDATLRGHLVSEHLAQVLGEPPESAARLLLAALRTQGCLPFLLGRPDP